MIRRSHRFSVFDFPFFGFLGLGAVRILVFGFAGFAFRELL